MCFGVWTGTKADSLQMEDREIKKGKERGCSNGGRLRLLLVPGRRADPWELHQETTPRPLAFFPSFLRGEPSVCNGFSSPETVVLFHQTLLNPQPGDSSSAAPGPALPPPGPRPPLLASVLTSSTSTSSSSSSRRRHPRRIPTPHPNFGDRERGREPNT